MRFARMLIYSFLLSISFAGVPGLGQSERVPVSGTTPLIDTPQHGPVTRVPRTRYGTLVTQPRTKAPEAASTSALPQTSGLSFAPSVVYGSGGFDAVSVVAADLNGDGKLDVVTANVCASFISCSNSAVGVLLGNGDGTFQTAVSYSSGGWNAVSLAVADVNGDGKPDVVVANACMSSTTCTGGVVIGVLLGNGDGTFQPAATFDSGGSGAGGIAVADVSGDGKPDLLVATECVSSSDCSTGAVSVLLGNGDGTFQAAVSYESGGSTALSIKVADVNGDGELDLLVANECATSACSANGVVGVLLGNGDGTFQTAVSYDSGGTTAISLAAADLNGDGKSDIIVANDCGSFSSLCSDGVVSVLLGNGDGTFQTGVPYGSGGLDATSVAVADVNGDGKLDLVVANLIDSGLSAGVVGVLLGNGDGTFQTAVTYGSGGSYAYSVAASDLNGDGRPDLLTGNACSCTSGLVGVLLNTNTAVTTATLTSSANPSNLGQTVAFTATVSDQAASSWGAPTGTITFYDGGTSIGSANLDTSGGATLATSALALGTHGITVTYSGNTKFASSTSTVLSQSVQEAIASISPTNLSFTSQLVSTSSAAQSVTLGNSGNIPLTPVISIVGVNSGDFSQTNDCGSSVAAGGSCTIGVTFTPLSSGMRLASLSIADNATGSPQMISLTGAGQDFSMNPSSGLSATVAAGQTAYFALTISSAGGFNQTVSFTCDGSPAQSKCSLSPNSADLNGSSPVTLGIFVTTNGSSANVARAFDKPRIGNRLAFWLPLCGLPAFVLVGIGDRRRRWNRAVCGVVVLCLLAIGVGLTSCGNSGSMKNQSGAGTPSGTYTILVTGTFSSGATSLTHTSKLTLNVE